MNNRISEDLLEELHQTKRTTVKEIDDILYEPIKVLDHGFVRVIDYMGDDNAVVQAARVSYGKGTKKVSQDRGLIQYLMRHRHTTPFEMCDIKFHVKLPIFVARQWIRHRTASVNEYSARYSIMSKEFYIPERNHVCSQSSLNKQGRDTALNDKEAARVLELLNNDAQNCYKHYQEMLNLDEEGNILDPEREGLTRELARMNLTLNYYTEWYWKTNLHNLLHFISLRSDDHAQYEIKAYSDVIMDIVKKWVPLSFEAFEEFRIKCRILSGNAVKLVKKLIAHEKIDFESSGMTKREWTEFCEEFNIS